MSEKKDFLESIAADISKKPASFQEEKMEVVKKKMNPWPLIIALIVLLIAGILAYFLFFRANITMPDFYGKNYNDVTAWCRQYEIETTGIVFEKQYSDEFDNNTVISQSVHGGEKIRKDAKITFVISEGADPQESILFPDLYSMNLSEINDWIKSNKLINTKVSQVYDDKVEEGYVVSYELRNIDESDFVRGSALTINISKGVKPLATITVDTDYTGKSLSELLNWASQKNLLVNSKEVYDEKTAAGYIVSIDVSKGDKLLEGSSISCSVSKGKAVRLTDFTGYTEEEVLRWMSTNGVSGFNYEIVEVYGANEGKVNWQDKPSGTVLKEDTLVKIYVAIGDPDIKTFYGTTVDDLNDWIKEANKKSAALKLGTVTYEINENYSPGQIIRFNNDKITVSTTLNPVVSKGRNVFLKDDNMNSLYWSNVESYNEEQIRSLCNSVSGLNYRITYAKDPSKAIGTVISCVRSDTGLLPQANTYITQMDCINIVICESN